jgi:hypothetical protein
MVAATSSPEVDGLVGIWGGGSWDPTQISGGEDPVDDELRVTGQPVKTMLRSRAWRTMAASLGVVTLSKASSLLVSSLHSASWRCAAAGENRAPTLVMAGDGGVTRHYLLEVIAVATCIYPLVLLRGETLDLGLPDRTMAALPASFYLLGIFLEQLLDVGGCWWSGIHLPHCWR